MIVRRTGRWRAIVVVALFAAAVGVLAKRPAVLLVGVLGVAFALYPRLLPTPSADLSLDRRVSDARPTPGDDVAVTATVTNEGDRTLWDLRVVDGVPGMLRVSEGTARQADVLRPGDSTTFEYTLEAAPGTHAFDPATVLCRDPAGAVEVEAEVSATTSIECATSVPDVPLVGKTSDRPGAIVTDSGGAGIEFHGVREYRSGDPLGRVDWRRYAGTGDLVTVEFHEERSADVVVVIDARAPAYCGRPAEPHAVARSIAAASRLVPTIAGSGHHVGLAVLGREFGWLDPGSGPDHVAEARRMLAAHPGCSYKPPLSTDAADAESMLTQLRPRLGRERQVLVLSPIADDDAEALASRLSIDGHDVTVLSPNVDARDSVGQRLAALERENRVSGLRAAGVDVIDWATDEPLGVSLVRARKRRRA